MNKLNKDSAVVQLSAADWITAPIIIITVYSIVKTFIDAFFDGGGNSFPFVFSAGYCLILASVFLYTKKARRPNVQSIVTAGFCTVLGLSVSFYGDIAFSLLTILLLFVLTASLCLSLSGSHAFPVSGACYLFDVLHSLTVRPFLSWIPMTRAAFSFRKKGRGIGGAVLGAVLAVPVLAVVVVLLDGGDAAFENLTAILFSGPAVVSIPVALVLSAYIFSVMFAARNDFACPERDRAEKNVLTLRCLPVSVINGFLGAVSAVYVVYLLSQLTYFFGAFGGSLPESVRMTVAEYSRRGFFELSAVAVINLGLLFFAMLFAKRENGKIAKSVKGLSLFLCVFTEMLMITVMSKMALYISRFGLTRKRVLVTAAILVLFLTFICVIIRLFSEKFPYMKIVFAAFLAVYSLLSLVNVNAVIADYNVNAFLSGRLETVDTGMLSDFGTAGIEPLTRLTQYPDRSASADAKKALADQFSVIGGGLFRIDEKTGEITLENGAWGVYDYVVLRRVQKNAAVYTEIFNEFNSTGIGVEDQ